MPQLSASEPFLHPCCEIVETTFGAFNEIGEGTRLRNVSFGDYSYCDRFCDISNTQIGKFCNIAAMTRIGPTDHPIGHAALHHFHYRTSYYWHDMEDDAVYMDARASRRTVLGHDCWIGHGAIIKPDVTIGIGAIVASGAVVTKDVAPFTIVSGVPATPLRLRFPAEIGARLLALAWWDWDHDRLREALPDFRRLPAEAFLNRYGG